MKPVTAILAAVLLSMAGPATASAQQGPGTPRGLAPGRTIVSPPGETPSFITPQPNGGYTIQRLGESPTFVTPLPNGTSIHQRPGEPPVIVQGSGIPRY